MASSREFADEVIGRLLPFGPVTARRMFGGFGVYLDGVMFGLIAFDAFYLKADDGNRDEFLAAGVPPFTYQRGARQVSMSYYRVPGHVFADGAVLADWAGRALEAARRGKRPGRRTGRRGTPRAG